MMLAALLLLAACGGTDGEDVSNSDVASDSNERLDSEPQKREEDAAAGPADRGATGVTSDAAAVCLSDKEAELARLVNEYRATKGLPAVPVSKSLTLVAQQHVWDSNTNGNNWPAPPAGEACNMHSWSANVNPALKQGTWTATCFTGSPNWHGVEGSWNKPRELAGYPSDGYENSHWASNGTTPQGALTGWKNSPGHNAVITEQNGWGPFKAMGVGISGNYAHLWFGDTADPAGEAQLCSGGGGGGAAPTATTVPAAEPTAEATAASAEPTAEATAASAEPTATAASSGGAAGLILNTTGTVPAGGSVDHVFDVLDGKSYTITVSPASDFDSAPAYSCKLANGSMSGDFDTGFDGESESTSIDISSGNGTCTVTVGAFGNSTGAYTINVTSP